MLLFCVFLTCCLYLNAFASPFDSPIVLHAPRKVRCTASDPCWPSAATWQRFNASMSGRLIASRPSAATCHDPDFNATTCAIARTNWTDSQWRTDQVGGYSALVWELGAADQCYPDSIRITPCGQGLVAALSLDARSVEDIQAGIRFASAHSLYLTVKNTGHDHLGRSSGAGSFAIWTHHMKGRAWHEAFVPENAPAHHPAVRAVTLQAGEQWKDVYDDADAHGALVVGGAATTVGAVGGYVLGGGHSPFAHFYGLAADNVVEMRVVTPTGELVVVNEFSDPEYFWALRGGGGSAWGIVMSVTYRVHPLPSHMQVVYLQANMSSVAAYRAVYSAALRALPALTTAGYTGYGDTTVGETVQFVFLQPNGTSETLQQGMADLEPLLKLNGTAGIVMQVGNFTLPSWRAYRDMFLRDPNIATNVQDASRLLSADVLLHKADEIIDIALQYPDMSPGHNFIGKVNSSQRSKTAVHPAWNDAHTVLSFGVDWDASTSEAQKRRKKQQLVEVSRKLEKLVSEQGGTYLNEANPYEPRWREAFWGRDNYERLLRVKHRIDPKNLMVCNRCVGTDVIYEP